MLKSDSRSRSLVGRMAFERGPARDRPLRRPPTIRMSRTARCAGCGLPCTGGSIGLIGRRDRAKRCLEIGLSGAGQLFAELIAQHPTFHLAHLAPFEVAELERSVGDADEPRDGQAEMLQHAFYLAVL